MTDELARRWLKIASAFTASIGVGVALLSLPGLAGAAGELADLLFADPQPETTPLARLLAAIAGGVLAGWAVTMWVVVDRLHADDPALVRAILLPGLVGWFVIDSVGSVISGGGLNVIGNIGFLALFGVPLFAGRESVEVGGSV